MAETDEKRKDMAKKWGKLAAAVWQDESLKKRFIDEPKQVLKEYGIDAPADMELAVVENTKDKTYIVLPEPPSEEGLTDEQLEGLAATGVASSADGAGWVAAFATVSSDEFNAPTTTSAKPPIVGLSNSRCIDRFTPKPPLTR